MNKIYILILIYILCGSQSVIVIEKARREADVLTEAKIQPFSYDVPLEEIGERIEHIYTSINRMGGLAYNMRMHSELDIVEHWPKGESIVVLVYLAEGNRVVFIPKEETNATIILGGQPSLVKYSPQHAGYVFYCLIDWATKDQGVPINYWEYGDNGDFAACIARADKRRDWHKKSSTFAINQYYEYSFALEELAFLGEVEVGLHMDEGEALPRIPVENNPYIEVMTAKLTEMLGEEGRYGSYQFYLDAFDLSTRPDRDEPNCLIGGAIEGEDMREVVYFEITEDVAIPAIYPKHVDSDYVFMDYASQEEREKRFTEIIDCHRGSFSFEVTERKEEEAADRYEEGAEISERMFPNLTLEEAVDCIEYVLSYSDWFGMEELAYQDAKVLALQGKEVFVYQHKKSRKILFSEKGSNHFYSISINPYADGENALPTTLCSRANLYSHSYAEYLEELEYLGNTRLEILALSSYHVPGVDRDEYVKIVEEQIERLLTKENRIGTYNLYIGEYEAMYLGRGCISAAVIGEGKSYYFRYYITSVGDTYYCWPVGFGLDESLEECEAEAHYMNQICIDRTVELNRYVSEIVVE